MLFMSETTTGSWEERDSQAHARGWEMTRRRALWVISLFVGALAVACSGSEPPPAQSPISSLKDLDTKQLTKLEAEYILSCQYLNPQNSSHGIINNVYGALTWVVPRENGLAILGLVEAARILGSQKYLDRANLAADALIGLQDPRDGAWYDQYDHNQPYKEGLSKSPTQTGEVLMALAKLGPRQDRFEAMKNGANFLLACADRVNKKGNDDGLLGGGKDPDGQFRSLRWTSDNSFAYHGLKSASAWASIYQDVEFAQTCEKGAQAILDGVNRVLRDRTEGVWFRAVDGSGRPDQPSLFEWINYAPQMLNLPADGVGTAAVGEWIHKNLQREDGACVWDNSRYRNRKSPGFSFQASLAWLSLNQKGYSNSALDWALKSGLWQRETDSNGVKGGWVDWEEDGNKAPFWQRFIDTSFYAIAVYNGGYNFKI